IPVAEDSGLILPIGEWALQRACGQAVDWQREGLPAMPAAVNVSSVQLARGDFPDVVARALRRSGLQPALLELELTESAVMALRDRAEQVLAELHGLGVRISLDDFGTGYSSIGLLKRLPLSTIKVDRSFVAALLTDPATASVTEAIVAMSRILG